MRISFQDARHLISLVVALVGAVGAFVLVRAAVVPAGWGQYGHYRGGAIEDNRTRPVAFAGQAECVLCHDGQAEERKTGKHAKINCEACHGPQAKHVASEGKEKPAKLEVKALCLNCHEKDSAKPVGFPQVAPVDHYPGTPCNDCHKPHQPAM